MQATLSHFGSFSFDFVCRSAFAIRECIHGAFKCESCVFHGHTLENLSNVSIYVVYLVILKGFPFIQFFFIAIATFPDTPGYRVISTTNVHHARGRIMHLLR